MAAPRSPSQASTFASQNTTSTTASQNAALLGASTAFKRPLSKARAPINTYAASNGALAAATTTGRGSQPSSPQHGASQPSALPLFPNATGESGTNRRSNIRHITPIPLKSPSHPTLAPPSQRGHIKSPSQQAAALAAARASPSTITSPEALPVRTSMQNSGRPAVAPKPRRFSGNQYQDSAISRTPTDVSSIAPTISLVDLFERKSTTARAPCSKPGPIIIKPSGDLAIKSPKPVRTSGGITSMFRMDLDEMDRAAQRRSPEISRADSLQRTTTLASTDSYTTASEDITPSSLPVAQRNSNSFVSISRNSSIKSAVELSRTPPLSARNSVSSAINIPKLPPRTLNSPPKLFSPYGATGKSLPAQYNQLHPPRLTPSLTGDQLANAMVAGSIASSRAPSPRRMEPPPLPPGRRHKVQDTFAFSRTPSPSRVGMRHTLRKTESDSSDDEDPLHPYGKHKKKRLVRKHPNKHHEGDRKRWRDALKPSERQRYEGVWAANRGLHYSFTTAEEMSFHQAPNSQETIHTQEAVSDQVSNIVARDIWSRSRLPDTVLETVWDLVDNESVGRLSKEEFVVGMWLIDQRLKGRKLPVKVGDTVWTSVRGLQGIKIRK